MDQAGVSIEDEGKDLSLSSFTLDMSSVFENYLLNALRLNRGVFPEKTFILDGNKEGRKKFYNQPSSSHAYAKPDFILQIGDECKVLVDAKYKDSSKETDRYQIISHALSYNSNIAVLVLPMVDFSPDAPKLHKIGTLGDSHTVDVYEYYFDLSSEDLAGAERNFSKVIASLAH
jgi:5-methylcytosine-specific restriction enzyme subunit McrC